MRIVSNWVLTAILLCLALPVHGAESFPPHEPAGKFFLSDIQLSGTCVKEVSADGLRTMLASAIPRDVLQLRNLQYEDIRPYQDLTGWAPEEFSLRDPRNVMAVLRKMDVKKMLRLEVSCLPVAPGRPAFVLTGRLIDVNKMEAILKCQDSIKSGGRSRCHTSGDVYDATTFAFVEMQSFSEFLPAVRDLFARLLQVPEIILETQRTEYKPMEPISLVFSVRRNEGNDGSFAGSSVATRELAYDQWVVQLDPDKAESICASPETYWYDLACDSSAKCSRPPIPFHVFDLKGGRVVKRLIAKSNIRQSDKGGGDRILIQPPSATASYLVRAQVTAKEGSLLIPSSPIYHCLHVRVHRHYVAMNVRVPLQSGCPYSTIPLYSPRFVYGWGADLLYLHGFALRGVPSKDGGVRVSGGAVGIGAGYTYLHGDMANCGRPSDRCPNSHILEVRALYSQELYRRGSLIVGMPIAVGTGAEWMLSLSSITQPRSYGTLSGSLGISAAYSSPGAIGLEYELGVLFEVRSRLFAGGTPTADLDSIAIPDLLIGGLIQVTVRLAAIARSSAP